MKIVTVNTNNKYNVYIDKNCLSQVSNLLFSNGIDSSRRLLVITDSNVDRLYSGRILSNLKIEGYNCEKFVAESGEEQKNLATVESIVRYLASNNYQKKDVLIALGGGVIGDITGLCASLYMRGIDFVQIPTTLLSAVDASVGGKTAVDLPEGKNLIGTFYQPKLVICDIDILNSLPSEIFNEGISEIIKYGIIKDNGILGLIENNLLYEQLEEIVYKCIQIKSNIVTADEKDLGLRRILNFGHTFAHALEKCSYYKISHGRAVAEGIIFETVLSSVLSKCSIEYSDYVQKIVNKYFCFSNSYSFDELYNAMKSDKKNNSGYIKFVLIDGNNNTDIIDVNKDVIKEVYSNIY